MGLNMTRRPVIAGNWKMYKTVSQTRTFFEAFRSLLGEEKDRDIVVCPTFPNLAAAVEMVRDAPGIAIGGQNLYWAKEGAFTGEVSGEMLAAIGCRWTIAGHSERRQYFGETDATVNGRTQAALEAGLTPIVCVGESLIQREAGHTHILLERQFLDGIAPLTGEQFAKIVIAYEPVWAIGTGKTATPEMAGEAHAVIRRLAAEKFGADAAAQCRILYGGSVKPDNIAKLMAQEEIDGALVGGASLDPVSFASIVNY